MKPSHQGREHIHHPKCFLISFVISHSLPSPVIPPPSPGNHWSAFCYQISLHFLETSVNEIIQYVLFVVQILLLSMVILRFIHVLVCINFSFSFISEQCSIVHKDHSFFIQSLVDGHSCCIQFGTVTDNKMIVNIHVQPLYEHMFSFDLGNYIGMNDQIIW